jgi:hypothetical protein
MRLKELKKILDTLDEDIEVLVGAWSPQEKYDRTSEIKICKDFGRAIIICDKNTEYWNNTNLKITTKMKYIFRGNVVFNYDPKTKQMTIPDVWVGRVNGFNYCKFTPGDYILISDFFKTSYEHAIGIIKDEDLKDIITN